MCTYMEAKWETADNLDSHMEDYMHVNHLR